jgi:hypothetical protein
VAELLGLLHDVEARDGRTALVGAEERGQDPDGGGLTGAVRTEQTEDAAAFDDQVDAAERLDFPVALLQSSASIAVVAGTTSR